MASHTNQIIMPSKYKVTLFWIVYAVFLFLITETMAQLYFIIYPRTPAPGYDKSMYIYDPILDFKHQPDFIGTFPSKSYNHISININSLGLRDIEIPLSKSPFLYRILAVGDSITFGPGVPQENTYPKQLQKLLNADSTTYQVVNAGVSFYHFEHYYAFIKEYSAELNPDHILIGFCINDIRPKYYAPPSYFVREMTMRSNSQQAIYYAKRLIERFALFKIREELYVSTKYGRERYQLRWINDVLKSWRNENLVSQLRLRLKLLKRLLDKRKVKLSIMIFPELHQIVESRKYGWPREKLANILQELGIEYLDLYGAFTRKEKPEKYYLSGDPVHFTSEGHSIIAEQIHRFLSIHAMPPKV